ATNRNVAAIAQLDSSNVPTLRYVLDPAGGQPVYRIDNVDVGDPEELIGFVEWSIATCPARRQVLVLSGHGAAWEDQLAAGELGLDRTRFPVPVLRHPRRLFGSGLRQGVQETRFVLIDGAKRDYLSNAELGAACERLATLCGDKLAVLVFDAC